MDRLMGMVAVSIWQEMMKEMVNLQLVKWLVFIGRHFPCGKGAVIISFLLLKLTMIPMTAGNGRPLQLAKCLCLVSTKVDSQTLTRM
jgi:hypothetical protein